MAAHGHLEAHFITRTQPELGALALKLCGGSPHLSRALQRPHGWKLRVLAAVHEMVVHQAVEVQACAPSNCYGRQMCCAVHQDPQASYQACLVEQAASGASHLAFRMVYLLATLCLVKPSVCVAESSQQRPNLLQPGVAFKPHPVGV